MPGFAINSNGEVTEVEKTPLTEEEAKDIIKQMEDLTP